MNMKMRNVKKMSEEQTKVKVSLGFTANVGNFQAVRVDIGIEDHRRDGETMDCAVDRVYKYVEAKLEERLEETVSEIKKGLNG